MKDDRPDLSWYWSIWSSLDCWAVCLRLYGQQLEWSLALPQLKLSAVWFLALSSGPYWSASSFDESYSYLVGIRKFAKLGEIKLKQIQQLNTADSSLLVRKHKEVLNLMMRTLQLDTYGLTLAQFFKGVGVGGLLVWLLMRWVKNWILCDGCVFLDVGWASPVIGLSHGWSSTTSFLNR